MKNKKVFFVPGGPGLNSFAEENLLKNSLLNKGFEAFFWNEPSNLRKDGVKFSKENAYRNWSNSLINSISEIDGKIILIGSSFGAIGCLQNLEKFADKIEKIVLISPTLFLNDVFKKMMEMAYKDFNSIGETEKANTIKESLNETKFLLDSPMQLGLDLTYQDPKLFFHYWNDTNLLAKWAKFLENPKYGMDLESQNAVLAEYKANELALTKIYNDVKVDVCVGKNDPVYFKNKVEDFLSKHFGGVTYYNFEKSSHFPHLEESEKFIEILIKA